LSRITFSQSTSEMCEVLFSTHVPDLVLQQ
jgi:hypothetical protein